MPARPHAAPTGRRDAAWLAAIVILGAAVLAIWALRVPGWSVMTDELLYVKLALHTGDTLSPFPAVHGESFSQYTPIYPLVLAPLYGLLSTPAAFAVAHSLNALLVASAAIPAFLLARDVGARRIGAYLAAVLTIVAPWTVYSFFLMTEALAYPVFVWAVLACERAVAGPSWRRDVMALAAIALAVLTRTQFVVLAVALPGAVVLHELSRGIADTARGPWRGWLLGRGRAVVREHAPLAACVAFGVAAVAALTLTGGVGRATGNYHVLFAGDSIPPGTLSGVRPHLVILAVGVGIVPFLVAIAWVLDALLEPRDQPANALAALMLLAVPAVVLVTAAFNRRQLGDLVQDRYEFYVVPLLFAAAGALPVRRAPAAVDDRGGRARHRVGARRVRPGVQARVLLRRLALPGAQGVAGHSGQQARRRQSRPGRDPMPRGARGRGAAVVGDWSARAHGRARPRRRNARLLRRRERL